MYELDGLKNFVFRVDPLNEYYDDDQDKEMEIDVCKTWYYIFTVF